MHYSSPRIKEGCVGGLAEEYLQQLEGLNRSILMIEDVGNIIGARKKGTCQEKSVGPYAARSQEP